jgi:hypothetical protein
MPSSKQRVGLALAALAAAAFSLLASNATAQQQAQGFDLERLYTSAAGGGWFVMDTLDMHGALGGAVNGIVSYARDPLRIRGGATPLAVVSDEAFFELGFAATYDRFRLYIAFDTPLTLRGNSGTVDGYIFAAPIVDLANNPDAITNAHIGFDARLVGDHASAFRFGLGAQLWIPGGAPGALQDNYLSDGPPGNNFGRYNVMLRALFAGDIGAFTYAGQLGVNLRTLDEAPTPESPQGSELLFGVAGGAKFSACGACQWAVVVGPEVFGETAFKSFFGTDTTGVESLLTARLEGTADDRPQFRFKLGGGAGLNAHFGAPEWRVVFGMELLDRTFRTKP